MLAASVVIPHGGSRYVGEQLAALARQRTSVEWELLVVVNHDGPAPDLPEGLPPTRVIRAVARRAVSYARNVGAAAAGAPLLLFCDDDDVVADGWVQAMVDAFVPGVDLVVGRIDLESLNPSPYRDWRPVDVPEGAARPHGFLPSGSSACLAVRAEVFAAIDGFTWMTQAQDVDLCWRAQLAGYSLTYAGDAVVAYRFRHSVREHWHQSRLYGRSVVHLLRAYGDHGLRNPWLEAPAAFVRVLPRPKHYRGRRVTAAGVLGQLARAVGTSEALLRDGRRVVRAPGLSGLEPVDPG